jgi:hypothetical protein
MIPSDSHTRDFMSHPLVESIGRNHTSSVLQRVAKCGKNVSRLRPCIDHSCCAGHVFRPRRDQSPAHLRETSSGNGRILTNHGHGLRWCDVVPGRPIYLSKDRIEVLFDDLFSSR